MVGNLPFEGAHPAQVLRRVLDGEFVAPERKEPRVGAGYARIVCRALSRDPLLRYPSVQALADALNAELTRLGFADTEQVLAWLTPSAEYSAFSQRIVPELVRVGQRGRTARQMTQAAEDFNRALAYRPGDAELVRHISGLRRLHQLRRGVVVSALGLVGIGVPLALVGSVWLRPAPAHDAAAARLEPTGAEPATPPVSAATPPTPAAASATPQEPKTAEPDPSLVAVRNRTRRPTPPVAAALPSSPPSERDVVVRITGAMGGTLRIDGQPRDWFGVSHKLSVGTHRFEFVPPDESCCEGSTQTVAIVEGEGPQQVVGDISFREATLRVSVPGNERGIMTCRTLFSGDQRIPGERRVSMSRPSAEGDCILRGEEEGAAPVVKKRVTLRAGQPMVIQWP
jgi:hypothetical protein